MALPTRVNRSAVIDPIEAMQREFDGMFGRYLNGRGPNGDGGSRLSPYGVDVREDADHIYVEAELPGFKKDDVDITLQNQTLTITAERNDELQKKGELLLSERRYTRFLRSITLPPSVDEQTVNARLQDGVLTVMLNKREESKPRKISVA